ncbi:hypothetical protein THH46_31365 [Pseudomonas sp. NA13]
MIMNAHASRMAKVGIALKAALDQAQSVVTNETIELSPQEQRSVDALRLQLKKESMALYAQEFETVLNIIKQSPPTMTGVIWLKTEIEFPSPSGKIDSGSRRQHRAISIVMRSPTKRPANRSGSRIFFTPPTGCLPGRSFRHA